MKLSALTLLLAVFCLASCDNDEKENELIIDSVEDIISGTYQGYSTFEGAHNIDNPLLTKNETVTITAVEGSNKFKVSFLSVIPGYTLNLVINDAIVSYIAEGKFKIEGNGKADMAMGKKEPDQKEPDQYDASLTGTIEKGATQLIFTVPIVMGGTTITFIEGAAPDTEK